MLLHTDYDDCVDNPCGEYGTCIDGDGSGSGSFMCYCADGFSQSTPMGSCEGEKTNLMVSSIKHKNESRMVANMFTSLSLCAEKVTFTGVYQFIPATCFLVYFLVLPSLLTCSNDFCTCFNSIFHYTVTQWVWIGG